VNRERQPERSFSAEPSPELEGLARVVRPVASGHGATAAEDLTATDGPTAVDPLIAGELPDDGSSVAGLPDDSATAGEVPADSAADRRLPDDSVTAGEVPADSAAAGRLPGDGPTAVGLPSAGAVPGDDGEPAVLPDRVRQRIVAVAAEVLGGMTPDEVPSLLRPVARFTPARRVRHGGPALAATLAADPAFRQRVGSRAAELAGPLGESVAAGRWPAAADPVEVAALAYLLRPTGWAARVAIVAEQVRDESGRAELAARSAEVDRLTAQLERLRAQSRADVDRARAESAALREELDRVRNRGRELTRELKAAELEARRATEALSTERGRAAANTSAVESENRRLRARLADAEAAVATARTATREGRSVDDARLWLLMETVGQAVQGLRRELALTPPAVLPGDLVAEEVGAVPPGGAPVRALATDDPARLDQLLALPRVHLVVDGYNVTKTGYGDLSLEQQRARLISGLAVLGAQTGAEVTVVFDGAERPPAAPAAPRGVRVLFSRPGEIADEVIRRLVRAEPAGRPIVVISSDREIADGVRRAGAHPLASVALIRRLGRS
jgi:predicted RNA-binding protein with PIN domain